MRVAVVVAAAAVAYATLLQPPGCNQTAHYALVQSLARGTARIDRFHDQTCDTAYVDGHFYAAKAPGLALVTLPWFFALKAVSVVPRTPSVHGYPAAMGALPRRALWQVGLFGAVLPAIVLALLVIRVAEKVEPETGLPVAAAIGLGTLVLPFATLFFAHVLAACLGFAAFALLYLQRRPLVAGVVAGLAVCVDFPLALVVAALAVYAWRSAPRFVAGAVVGVVPLLAFDQWAFGSAFHLSYANAVLRGGASGHAVLGANSSGFYGIGVPSLRVAAELLFSPRGLLILSPVLLAALAGLVVLARGPRRREAFLCLGVFLVFLVYNSGYYLPFGGYVPGPRFLIATLPFLAVGLAAAFGTWRTLTSLLAAVSVAAMTIATAADPFLGNDDTHSWIVRWHHGDFVHSVLTGFGLGHGWLAVAPFLVAVAVGALAAAPRPSVDPTVLVPLAAIAILWLAAPDLLRADRTMAQRTGLIALIVLLVALLAVIAIRTGPALLCGVPLLALALPGFAAHTKESLAACVVSLAAAAAVHGRRRRGATSG